MKEGPIGVRRYWTIGCLAIVLTMLCVGALPQARAGSPLAWLPPALETVGLVVVLLVTRRRLIGLDQPPAWALLGPVLGVLSVGGAFAWAALRDPAGLYRQLGPIDYVGVVLLGLESGALVQFLIVGFLGQVRATRA